MDRTFETVEDMRLPSDPHFKTLVVHIAAYFTSHIIPLLIHFVASFSDLAFMTRSLGLLDILTSRAGFSHRGFGFLRDIRTVLSFEAIANHMDRL